MKITAVKTVIVNATLRNWVFVKVETDVEGLHGWGEATLEWQTRAVKGAIEDLTPIVLGQDPRRIEHLWQAMVRDHFFQGGVVTMSAISGIDQALWDIKSRWLDVPAWELLGGSTRDWLRMYDHLGGGDSNAVYGAGSLEDIRSAAARAKEDGFTALKVLAVPTGGGLPNQSQLDRAANVMQTVREAVGTEVEIMVDLHGRTTPDAAIAYAIALAPYRPWFFEEPCQPGNPLHLRYIADKISFPVATGERLISIQEFRDLLQVGGVAVLQPDVCHVGGPTAFRKIAALAESHHVTLAPHNPLGPVATVVNQHLGFATPCVMIQEVMRSDVPWRDEVIDGILPIHGGQVQLPTAPGWGVEVNEEAAESHPYRPELQITTRNNDGSVTDW